MSSMLKPRGYTKMGKNFDRKMNNILSRTIAVDCNTRQNVKNRIACNPNVKST